MYVSRLSSDASGMEFDQVVIPCKFSSYVCMYDSRSCLMQFYILFISSSLICIFSSPFSSSPSNPGLMLFVCNW